MKIGIVSEFFPPYITGGTELFLESLSEYLDQQGFEIVIITSEQNQGAGRFNTYKIKSSPLHISYAYQCPGLTTYWMYFNSRLQKKLRGIYEREELNILYVNNLFHLSFAPLQASKNIPVVLDIHDYWPVCFSRDLYYCNKELCQKRNVLSCSYCIARKVKMPFLSPFLVPGLFTERYRRRKHLVDIEQVICHSSFVSRILSQNGYKNRVITIPYPSLAQKRNANQQKGNPFTILFVGRLEKAKGAGLLIDVAKRLKEAINFRIDIIGKGSLLNKLDRKDLNIYVHGFLGEERFRLFETADCLLAPSRWPEPFGMVGLEAMAYNIPLITLKDSGGLTELVLENESGLVSDRAEDLVDCILELYYHPESVESIQRNCSKNIVKYSRQKIFEEYEGIFRALVK